MERPLGGLCVADLSAGIAGGQDGIIGTRPASADSSRGFT